jgi:hypothetical protein
VAGGGGEGACDDALAFQDIFAAFIILYFACGMPQTTFNW